ncbi:MAG: TlpA disulfide reductase family protein [Candidatus Firestonebacteria bacterium]
MKKILVLIFVVFFAVNILYAQVNVGDKALDFTLTDLDGKQVSLKNFTNKSAVLLVFSTTWCKYCIEEIPTLNEIQKNYQKKGLKILSIDVNESIKKVASFTQKKNIIYTVLLDEKGEVAKLYDVYGFPTNLIIDKKGIIKYRDYSLPENYKSILDQITK